MSGVWFDHKARVTDSAVNPFCYDFMIMIRLSNLVLTLLISFQIGKYSHIVVSVQLQQGGNRNQTSSPPQYSTPGRDLGCRGPTTLQLLTSTEALKLTEQYFARWNLTVQALVQLLATSPITSRHTDAPGQVCFDHQQTAELSTGQGQCLCLES